MSRCGSTSERGSSIITTCDAEVSIDEPDTSATSRVGLGSTANENIALRRNYREMELLWKTQKTLSDEQIYVFKLIDLYEKNVQTNYQRLTKRVGRIKSHLTEEEINEMDNDLRKKEFADKYRKLLHGQTAAFKTHGTITGSKDSNSSGSAKSENKLTKKNGNCFMEAITEETEISSVTAKNLQLKNAENTENSPLTDKNETRLNKTNTRSQTCQPSTSRSCSLVPTQRSTTAPSSNIDDSEVMNDIIPSLNGLLDQLHNIKPHQFYENQRKLKLYEIRLLEEELEGKKADFFKSVKHIVNWNKTDVEEEEEVEEEVDEKPRQRKTSFMRSMLRNFSMELMMKTMQYGWTDLGQCRYLRNRGGDNEDLDLSETKTLAKDTMKIHLDSHPLPDLHQLGGAVKPQAEAGFDASGKMIRTADLLGLNSR